MVEVLDGVQDALVVTKPSGEVAFLNTAAMQLYDVPRDSASAGAGFNLLAHVLDSFETRTLDGRVVHEDDHPLVRALRGEAYKDVELSVKRVGDEDTRVYVFSGRRLDTSPPLSVLTVRDETDRWRADRRYRVAFEADPAPSVIARLEDGRILEANEGMVELTGRGRPALKELSLKDLRPLDQTSDLREMAERLLRRERVHKAKRLLLHADGQVIHVLLSARAIEVQGEKCGIFTYIDMTELETAQRERLKTERALEDTIRSHEEERAEMALLAITDPLTGIANRRGLNIRLQEELARAERYRDTFSILLLDLDHFKDVNDSYGHDLGDAALRDFAQLIAEECREPDLAGRWGGEEFMMILPQVDLAAAYDVASRVRERVEQADLAGIDGLTISVGVATLEKGDTPEDLFVRADRALYRAKEGGRNRVELSTSEDTLDLINER